MANQTEVKIIHYSQRMRFDSNLGPVEICAPIFVFTIRGFFGKRCSMFSVDETPISNFCNGSCNSAEILGSIGFSSMYLL